jgi:hypothetical protein
MHGYLRLDFSLTSLCLLILLPFSLCPALQLPSRKKTPAFLIQFWSFLTNRPDLTAFVPSIPEGTRVRTFPPPSHQLTAFSTATMSNHNPNYSNQGQSSYSSPQSTYFPITTNKKTSGGSATTSRSNSTSSSRSSYCSCSTKHSGTTAYGPGYTSAQAAQDARSGSLFTAWPADEPYRAPRL